ncbi:DNA translocase FtsK 4TM domain-containing protein [Aliivibrio kagoshimensis]
MKTHPKVDAIDTDIQSSGDQSRLNGLQRLKEAGFIIGLLISVYLMVALVSFEPSDPSWSQTAWDGPVKNAAGSLGAFVADTLFFILGLLAYLLPFIVLLTTWVFCRQRTDDEPLDLLVIGTRLLGLVMLLLTSCALADTSFDDIWYFSSGGVIGGVINSLTIPLLNVLGSTLVLIFLWCAGMTLFTGVSWLTIVDTIGRWTLDSMSFAVNKARKTEDETISAIEFEQQPVREQKLHVDPSTPDFSRYVESDVTDADIMKSVNEGELDESVNKPNTEQQGDRDFLQSSPEDEVVEERRFNIHGADDNDMAPSMVEEQLTPPPLYLNNLDATIEELDQASDEIEKQNVDVVEHFQQESDDVTPTIEVEPEPEPVVPQPEPSMSFSAVGVIDDAEVVSNVDQQLNDEISELEPLSAVVPADVDDDLEAFKQMIAKEQENMAASENPFLVQRHQNLPVPDLPLPTLDLLFHPETRETTISREYLEQTARLVEAKLADYKIKARVVDIFPGPVITRFELDLAPGVKVSRISGLAMDLARSLSALAVRVVEVIPGKPYVGLELPNVERQTVFFSEVIGSKQFMENTSPTAVVLGQDIAGEAVVADLSKMPHCLVAGTTGSGKSVGVNVMILSILYKSSPEDVRFIMIDPKMLELSIYEGIPHLLSEVVTDMKDAGNALRWCVGEMERRYKLLSAVGVRNLKGFNDKLKMAAEAGHPIHDPLWKPGDTMDETAPLLEKLPSIVVIVDEFADLMMVVGKKVEELIARLAQKARAAGIHLILATQRPSVDVITGLIKANIPTRVAFTVSTKTDSRTILDQGGAESLLGMGDMLYLAPGSNHPIRVHGAFASDDDVHAVVNNWKARGKPQYIEAITHADQGTESLLPGESSEEEEELDQLYDQVVEFVTESRRGSVSGVQRQFRIGYNRAARIVDQLQANGVVSAPGHNGNREVIAPPPVKG